MLNGQLHDLCCSKNITQLTKLRGEFGVACSGHGRTRYVQHIRRTTYRELTTWDVSIILQCVSEMPCGEGVNWTNVVHDRVY
jgi:hypothetical protein